MKIIRTINTAITTQKVALWAPSAGRRCGTRSGGGGHAGGTYPRRSLGESAPNAYAAAARDRGAIATTAGQRARLCPQRALGALSLWGRPRITVGPGHLLRAGSGGS